MINHSFLEGLVESHQKMYWQTRFASAFKTSSGKWAESDADRANTFAHRLFEEFRPYPGHVTAEEKDIAICSPLVSPCTAIQPITTKEIFSALQSLKYNKQVRLL